MAEAIVPHLLQILPRLERELVHASKYKQEFRNLKSLIESLEVFLKKSNWMETINDEIRASKKRARDLIYDSQDAIDDLMQHESNGCCGCLLFSRGRFVYRAEDIKKMLDHCKSIQEAITAMSLNLPPEHAMSSSGSSSSIAFFENDDQLEGIDRAKENLVRWLTQETPMSKVIFMHGAQGVGKTSLVGAVLRDARVKKCFKYYVWIKDSRSYGSVEGKENVLMEANVVMWDLTRKDNRRDQVKLREAFERMRTDNDWRSNKCKWVLVLDDAGKANVIESLQSILDSTRPIVLITTCDSSLELPAEKLASAFRTSTDNLVVRSGGAPPQEPRYGFFDLVKNIIWNPEAGSNSQLAQIGRETPNSLNGFLNFKHVSLSEDDAFKLLRQKMSHIGPCPNNLKEASKSILKKCEGLPLAILATCDLLNYKQGRGNGTTPSVIWENLSGKLGEELLSRGHSNDLIRRMITLRMDQLHDVHAHFFYLSIFPLDCLIRCSTLMRLWMAERFAPLHGKTTDPVIADEILRKLLDRNFVQEVQNTSYGRVGTCRVHNLLHEIIIKRSKDDDFAMIVADQEEELPGTIWRLSFHGHDGEIFQSQMNRIGEKVKRLRSLLVFKEVYPKSMEELLGQVSKLNVLHLEASSLNSFPKGIPRLKSLRYLKLGDTSVQTIPKDIRHLVHLETLDLKGTQVYELPDGILELKALRNLLVYRSDRSPDAVYPKCGVKAPSALGDLKSLQKLCMIKLNPVKPSKSEGKRRKREQLLGELAKLTSLRRLGISMLRSRDVGLLCSSVKKMTKLESLHLIAMPEEIIDLPDEDKGKAPACLQRVHLTGCFRKLPNWLSSPDRLVKLVLKRSQLNRDALQHLGELRGLKHLELQPAFDISQMTFKAGWFPQLRFLSLDKIDSLHSIEVEKEALPTLEILSLARCQSLKTVPRDITRPPKLICLELLDMPDEFKAAIEGNKEVRAQMKVKVKYWRAGTMTEAITLPRGRAGYPSDPRRLKK